MEMDKLLIFDGDFLLYYCTMGNKVLDSSGSPVRENNKFVYTDKSVEEVYKAVDDIITNILKKSSADYYIGYLGNSKSFRYSVDAEYKAKRTSERPMWFNEVKQYIFDHWNFIPLNNGLEADDAVNIIKNRLKNDFNIRIVTTDKDLIKCIPGRYINPKDLSKTKTSKESATIEFWSSMITGDTVDNIKGLPRKGKKFVEKLFGEETEVDVLRDLVIDAYKKVHDTGWEYEYNKNLQLLYILDEYKDLDTPDLIKFKKEVMVEQTDNDCSHGEELW